jgi:metal-sulfur cluster biosynthetic enzyme
MDLDVKINANPTVHKRVDIHRDEGADDGQIEDFSARQPIDEAEIFDLIRDICDPEHPHSLEELKVLQLDSVTIDDVKSLIKIQFTPTIPHCSMSTLIGCA